MASRQPDIQELRTRLETSRWQMYDGVQKLEERCNVPQRVLAEVTTHPIKWAAVSMGAGLVAGKFFPWLLRRKGRSWAASFLAPAIRSVGVAAFPMVVEAATLYFKDKVAQMQVPTPGPKGGTRVSGL